MAMYQELPDRELMMRTVTVVKTEGRVQRQEQGESVGVVGDESIDFSDGIAELADSMNDPDIFSLLSESSMRCGGCGSKVGAQVLTRALSRVKAMIVDRPEVICGLLNGDDDAALLRAPAPPFYLVHTIDYFRCFIGDPYLFGQIAANHALSDVFAMNGEPVSALALCVLPFGLDDKVEETLVQMLAGCLQVLAREGCALVGGHTSEGAEIAMGLSVQGVVRPDKTFLKRLKIPVGLQGGSGVRYALILTKALGTGTLMAAKMRSKVYA